jgi:hypothetical protein
LITNFCLASLIDILTAIILVLSNFFTVPIFLIIIFLILIGQKAILSFL